MGGWLKEPLLHFLVAGGVLFGGYAWLNPPAPKGDAGARQVRIGEGEVGWLVETWSRQWGRAPTSEELRGLVAALLKEEVLSREAREMRLDDGDTIVRRRLAQKMEFLLQDTARIPEPTEADLRKLYDAHPERFRAARRVSLAHVYFSPQRRQDAAADARRALQALAAAKAVDAAALGDPSMLGPDLREEDERAVAAMFGPDFAAKVVELEPGAWHGPIASSYGMHLVRVSEAMPARARPFEDVRPELLELWRDEQRRLTEDAYLRRLTEKYDIVLDERVRAAVGPGPVFPGSGAPQ